MSVVIPALEEAETIGWVLAQMAEEPFEIVLVVSSYDDRTVAEALRCRPDIRVTLQNRIGKGNALLCGFAACTGDVIVTLDADGSTHPREIPRFVDTLVGGADLAKGSRFLDGGGSEDLTRIRRWGNGVFKILTNLLCRSGYSDLCYGYNAMWSDVVDTLRLWPGESAGRAWGDGFEVETLLNVRAALEGLSIREVPSYEGARRAGASHLAIFGDGWRVLRTIWREWRAARRQVQPGTVVTAPATQEQAVPSPEEWVVGA